MYVCMYVKPKISKFSLVTQFYNSLTSKLRDLSFIFQKTLTAKIGEIIFIHIYFCHTYFSNGLIVLSIT